MQTCRVSRLKFLVRLVLSNILKRREPDSQRRYHGWVMNTAKNWPFRTKHNQSLAKKACHGLSRAGRQEVLFQLAQMKVLSMTQVKKITGKLQLGLCSQQALCGERGAETWPRRREGGRGRQGFGSSERKEIFIFISFYEGDLVILESKWSLRKQCLFFFFKDSFLLFFFKDLFIYL